MDASVRLALFELAGAVHMPRALPLFWKRLEVQGCLASLSFCFVPRFGREKRGIGRRGGLATPRGIIAAAGFGILQACGRQSDDRGARPSEAATAADQLRGLGGGGAPSEKVLL